MQLAVPAWISGLFRPLLIAWLFFLLGVAALGHWLVTAPPLDDAVEDYQPLPDRPEPVGPPPSETPPQAEAPSPTDPTSPDPSSTATTQWARAGTPPTENTMSETVAEEGAAAAPDDTPGMMSDDAVPSEDTAEETAGTMTPAPPTPGDAATTPGRPNDDPFKRSDLIVPAPHPRLVEETDYGLLPVIAPDGSQSWQVYAAPFDDSDTRPQIAIVVQDLGLKSAITNQAIRLPPEVTLSYGPYSARLEEWIDLSRTAGHEVLIEVPMEPKSFPSDDPGPGALLVAQSAEENLMRLQKILGHSVGYVGVANRMGDAFAEERNSMRPVVDELRRRGLLFFDGAPVQVAPIELISEAGLIHLRRDVELDTVNSQPAVQQRFAEAEQVARQQGYAIAVARATPVVIEMIENWLAGLPTKGLVAAPLTAIIAKRGA